MSQAPQEFASVDWSLSDPSLLRTQAYINGEWVDADDGATFKVLNPATHEVVAEMANVGGAETRRAIEAAEVAQKAWAAKSAIERSNVLRKWYDLVMANVEDLAILMTVEQGKILAESDPTAAPPGRSDPGRCAGFRRRTRSRGVPPRR